MVLVRIGLKIGHVTLHLIGIIGRLFQITATSLKRDLKAITQKLERLPRDVDSTAVATELLRASEFREGKYSLPITNISAVSISIADMTLERLLRDQEELKMKTAEWLRPTKMRDVHQSLLKDKLSGTCEWVWSHAVVANWKAARHQSLPDNRILSIYGIPGCGKSVLASSMVQSMKDQGDTVLFFSFSSMDSSRYTHDDFARSFLWQLLQDSTTEKCLDIMRSLMLKQPVTIDLWTAFADIAKLMPQPMI